MVRRIAALAAVLIAVSMVPVMGAVSSQDAGSSQNQKVLDFEVMTPVVEPFTGPVNPIRGVPGGGLPWQLNDANGELSSNGRLSVEIDGLVLASRAPVPPEMQGTNPIPSFKAIVSCLTVSDGAPATVNVETALAPATSTGDARIRDEVSLPSPCIAPIVFVTSPTGAWFAATGQ
jgi:hypothetical protein